MKKSNKLLVGGFLAVILFITAIHISLYAKYKSGDYTVYHEADELASQSMQAFPNILFVSVRNVPGATVKFSDVAEVEKSEDDLIQYVQKGDTLLITGSKSAQQDLKYPVAIQLPSKATVSVFHSSIVFEGSQKAVPNNPVIYLDKSRVLFSGEKSPLAIEQLKVVASDNSIVSFKGNTQVAQLEVQLLNSLIDCGEGNFNQLSIATDSLSRISLQSKHFLKANIKTITPQ